jgi:hypothetical protein
MNERTYGEHQLNWEAVSAIAEWMGVIVVVLSLAYVALQIRQNTAMIKAATELETGRQWSEFHSRMAHSNDMANIWDRGLTDSDKLTPAEKRKFIWLVAEYFFLVESLFRQRQLGFLGHDSWTQHLGTAASLLAHPVLESWWNSGVSPFSPDFVAVVDNAKSKLGESTRVYIPLSEL